MKISIAAMCNDLARLPQDQRDDKIREFIDLIGKLNYDYCALAWLGGQMKRLDASHLGTMHDVIRPDIEKLCNTFDFLDEIGRHSSRLLAQPYPPIVPAE
jgi:hypothetical protein